MRDQIVLLEIEGLNLRTGVVEILRFCDGLAYRLRPSESPANALYRPFLLDPGWSRVDIFTAPGEYGQVTPGECTLDDSNGLLGAELLDYAFDGRSIVQRIGRRGAPYPSGYVTVISGTMARQPQFAWGKITFSPADLAASMEKTLQQSRYAGTNVLPDGLEGLDDLSGKVKPIVLALASNMSPILCNTSKLIYQVSIPVGSSTVAVSAVRDGGLPLTAGAAYASVADLLATAPAAGGYRVLSTSGDGCYIRLGSQPAAGVTCDAAYGAAEDRTHAQAWRRVLNYAGVSSAAIVASDLVALDAALPAEIEMAVFDESNVDDVLSTIASSAGAAWYGDANGMFRITQWANPIGVPVAQLTALRTDSVDIDDPVGNGGVAPVYLVNLSYGRNWTKQSDSDLKGDKTSSTDTVRAPGTRAGLAARAWLAQEYRVLSSVEAGVLANYRNAVKLEVTSLISAAAPAQQFADSQLAMFKDPRQMAAISLWLSDDQINVVRPGTLVQVILPRWKFGGGRLMRVAGVQVDRRTKKTQITCWG
jgi:hypothetical protein